jgi:hypothetical protein
MRAPRINLKSRSIAAAAAATLAGGAAMAAAAPAWADYGHGSVYNIELSANLAGKDGGGAWIWIQLQANGTGEYQGSDCGHGQAPATPDSGTVSWSSSDGQLTISPVVLNGLGGFPATVTVPAAYGHYTGALGTYITLPFPANNIGTSQLQVAP